MARLVTDLDVHMHQAEPAEAFVAMVQKWLLRLTLATPGIFDLVVPSWKGPALHAKAPQKMSSRHRAGPR